MERGEQGWGKSRRDCAYPGVPVLSLGSAWLRLLCGSLSQRHDCIPLLTHRSSDVHTHTHTGYRLAASPCCLAPSLWASLAPPSLPTVHFDTHTPPWLPSLPAPGVLFIYCNPYSLSPCPMSVCFVLSLVTYKNLQHLFVEAYTADQHRWFSR